MYGTMIKKDGTVSIVACDVAEAKGDIVIPDTINGRNMT